MARAGVYKWDVQAARDKLVKAGKHPSIDAVRAELGNTGSKSTIHRYLKELEAEEGAGAPSKLAVSETLLDLVGQLSDRLKHEAGVELEAATTRFAQQRRDLEAAVLSAEQTATSLRAQLEQQNAALATERQAHADTAQQLQAERLRTAQLSEQVQALQARLQDQEAHRQSLEEKHQQAREALEHFRQATKEQREQTHHQHEHQVQGLQAEIRRLNGVLTEKYTELTLLNRDAARLTTELDETRRRLQDLRGEHEATAKASSKLQEQHTRLQSDYAASVQRAREVERERLQLREQLKVRDAQVRELELGSERLKAQKENGEQTIALQHQQLTKLQAELTVALTTADEAARKLKDATGSVT